MHECVQSLQPKSKLVQEQQRNSQNNEGAQESPSKGPPKPPRVRGGSNTATPAAAQPGKVVAKTLPSRQA